MVGVPRDYVFEPFRIEHVLVGRLSIDLPANRFNSRLGIEAFDVADSPAEKNPDHRLGLGHERADRNFVVRVGSLSGPSRASIAPSAIR